MKRTKNIIALFMAITFCIMLYGCGKNTPTDVVNNYFGKIQKGDFNMQELINTAAENSSNKGLGNNEISDETANKLLENAKEMTFKVNNQSINGDKATVNVTANSMDLGPVLTNAIREGFTYMLSQSFSNSEMTDEESDEYFNGVLNKYLDQVTFSDKTQDITLTKGEEGWKIEVDGSLEKLIIGINSSELEGLNIN